MQLRATRLTAIASAVKRAFDIRSLFAGSVPGVWYDPSDMSTLFQDSAGTTPVTAVEQPVGLMLDKSKGLTLGSELVTNGDFSNGTTGWTVGANWTIGSGVATSVATSDNALVTQGVTLTAGKTYQVTYTILTRTAGVLRASLGGAVNGGFDSAPGTYTYRLTMPSSQLNLFMQAFGFAGTIDNISVKELPGNHAFQATSASRPVLSARYNLLTKTEDFTNAAWVKTNLTLTTGVADPFGGANATTLTASGGAGRIYQGVAVPASVSMGMGIWVRRRTGTGTITFEGLGVGVGPTITPTASWQLVSATDSTPSTTGYYGIRINTPGDAIDVFGASLVPANQSTLPYQRVNTATDYNTTGFLPYLKFDGVDDSLSTNSISFTSTDKMSVFAGVRKLSDAATAIAVELSASAASNVGAFFVAAPVSAGATYTLLSQGNVLSLATSPSSYASPITNVVTGLGNISGDLATLRINGAQIAQSTADQGTGNYGNYPLYIGRRNNASLPFNGQLYSMIVVGKAVTAGELSSTETYVNSKTGAY